jgi:hypothetical protein
MLARPHRYLSSTGSTESARTPPECCLVLRSQDG